MKALIDVIDIALNIYKWVIIVSAVLSWLIAFNVVNYRNQIVAQIDQTLRALTEPVLAPIRARMPNTGAVDLSPVVLLLGIILIQLVLAYYVRPYVF
ncbi:YggT family protein [Phreatobacter stygius]|uniref:YggT family protein n=1 Tax=Phreatobacter stygius TaxID=1940610 RepID=A0A4D7B4Y7_9HYPH|nr:YggT family protein [Phreatobacter stygius]QCI64756.1 YggT family protein [Phreatobacter stygius]